MWTAESTELLQALQRQQQHPLPPDKDWLPPFLYEALRAADHWARSQAAVDVREGDRLSDSQLLDSVPFAIRSRLQVDCRHRVVCRFSCAGRSIAVQIASRRPWKHNAPLLASTMHRILLWFHVALHALAGVDRACAQRSIDVFCYWSSFVKTLPSKRRTLSPLDVNTAYTTSCPAQRGSIVVFRQQEWFKVLMHETLHLLHLDFSSMSTAELDRRLHQRFPVLHQFHAYECYTETWACVLHACTVAYLSTRKEATFWRQCYRLLAVERCFAVFQLDKVLRHMGWSLDALGDPRSPPFREDTHVFAYYILKGFCMAHLPAFVQQHPHRSVDFPKQASAVRAFAQWLVQHSDPRDLAAWRPSLAHTLSPFLNTTLRMTAVEWA